MFSTDLEEQGRKLMQMIAAAVHGLADLETLVPTVRVLGHRDGGFTDPQSAEHASTGRTRRPYVCSYRLGSSPTRGSSSSIAPASVASWGTT